MMYMTMTMMSMKGGGWCEGAFSIYILAFFGESSSGRYLAELRLRFYPSPVSTSLLLTFGIVGLTVRPPKLLLDGGTPHRPLRLYNLE